MILIISLSLSVCVLLCLSFSLSFCLSICLSVCLPVYESLTISDLKNEIDDASIVDAGDDAVAVVGHPVQYYPLLILAQVSLPPHTLSVYLSCTSTLRSS